MGFDYDMEQSIPRSLITLIIETENAIRHSDASVHNALRYLATKKIEQIKHAKNHNMIHKRHQYNLKQIATILEHNNLTIAKADKGKCVVIISKDALREKTRNFIQTNDMLLLTRDPTDHYQKQISQTIQKCTSVINKGQIKYLTQMKPTAPRLEALIKTHKLNNPIRPVINNIEG
jgi:hypothetical protein